MKPNTDRKFKPKPTKKQIQRTELKKYLMYKSIYKLN